jgi:hypothetical protein
MRSLNSREPDVSTVEDYSTKLTVARNSIKMYCFLLSWCISLLEKTAPPPEAKPKSKVSAFG